MCIRDRVLILVVGRKLTLIPTNKFVNTVEYGYQFVRNDMGEGIIGHGFKKHVPFLATLFFFILISNFVGLIPGCKTPTGTISVTWALATISFIYFNVWGIKAKGGLGYLKSFAPAGLPKVMVPILSLIHIYRLRRRPPRRPRSEDNGTRLEKTREAQRRLAKETIDGFGISRR